MADPEEISKNMWRFLLVILFAGYCIVDLL